jgi:mono/diheme cytochrome c family protein
MIIRGSGFIISCSLLVSLVGPLAAQKQSKTAPDARSQVRSGLELYKRHCAVCHGNDAKGGGPPPAGSLFKVSPPDLTTLSRRHDGKFPEAYVQNVLKNGVPMPDHGPAEMPVWGTAFKATTKADDAEVELRIKNLMNYLRSLQVK